MSTNLINGTPQRAGPWAQRWMRYSIYNTDSKTGVTDLGGAGALSYGVPWAPDLFTP